MSGVGLVNVATPQAVEKQRALEAGGTEIKDRLVLDSLTAYVRTHWERARNNKITSGMAKRLLDCDRQRKGEYDPAKLADIRKQGGSEIYMMLTDIKCRAALSWIKDVMQTYGDETWTLEPSNEPELDPEISDAIIEGVAEEARQAYAMGVTDHNPLAFRQRIEELEDEVKQKLHDIAVRSAEGMSAHIRDQLQVGKWTKAFDEFLNDFVTYPAAFVKGPVVRRRKTLKWGKNWKPEVKTEARREFYRVSPYDIFPSPECTTVQDGFICERVRFGVSDLQAMKGIVGYRDDQIDEVILRFGQGAIREWLYGDIEKNVLDGKGGQIWMSPHDLMDAIEFWGRAPGKVLAEWGMKGVKDTESYDITAILIGNNVIRAALNPDPLGMRPYATASFDSTPGTIWGTCPPELMSDIQQMCNATARALGNNVAIASGPLVEVTIDRLPDGERLSNLYPWKQIQTTSDKTGGGQQAIHFFQPDMHAQELLEIFRFFSTKADEATGIPNYVYGSGQSGGAGRTAHGLAMLMESASKGIKQAIGNIDSAVSFVISIMYNHNMLYDANESIKGDMKVVARGALGMVMREQLQEKRQGFLQATLNPIDAQIMGPDGRSYLLRETARPLQLDVKKLVPAKQLASPQPMPGMVPPGQPDGAAPGAPGAASQEGASMGGPLQPLPKIGVVGH